MGHAHHFLSRLDRVSLPHVEIALDLYNDVPLLQFILQSARIPDAAARVAISLDHPEDGPFLIVTRDGRFVTCLGAGMSPGEHPVITRGQLDGIAAKAGVLRDRMAAAARLAGPMGGVGKLLQRVFEAGDDLTREEFIAIAGLQPLYPSEFVKCLFAASNDLIDGRKILLDHLRKSDRLHAQFRGALRTYWNTLWSVGHFSILCAVDGWASLERWEPEVREIVRTALISWGGVREGYVSLAVRGLWAPGRIGKLLLPRYKEGFREAASSFTAVNAAGGLAMIALRHTKHRAEVLKALASGPDLEPSSPIYALVRSVADGIVSVLDPPDGLEPASYRTLQRNIGADAWIDMTRHLPESDPLRFERHEDVPEDLALCAAANLPIDFATNGEGMMTLFAMLPWVARAAPEHLYLPRAAIRATTCRWLPEYALQHLRLHRDHYGTRKRPVNKPEGPARKGPCPCGSGKKYKRCCGEAQGG